VNKYTNLCVLEAIFSPSELECDRGGYNEKHTGSTELLSSASSSEKMNLMY
jgi:hypothetical protein